MSRSLRATPPSLCIRSTALFSSSCGVSRECASPRRRPQRKSEPRTSFSTVKECTAGVSAAQAAGNAGTWVYSIAYDAATSSSSSGCSGDITPCAAMQAIAAPEVSPRGVYCGALGVVQPGGRSIFSVGIRTVTIAQNRAECGIGSGIIWDSIPSEEFAEGRIKRRFLLRASASFELLETLRLEAGGFRLLARHLERLQRSSVYFGFALDDYAARRALDELAAGHRQGAYRVRLLVSRTGAVTTEIFPLEPNSAVVQVALAERPIRQDDEFLRHKTTERSIYQGFTPKSPEIFDTLLFNDSGEITEFTRGNVMAEIGGQRVTPPLRCGLLPGTLRAQLLADGLVAERVIMKDDLAGASGLWFINGLRGIIPARFIPPFRA